MNLPMSMRFLTTTAHEVIIRNMFFSTTNLYRMYMKTNRAKPLIAMSATMTPETVMSVLTVDVRVLLPLQPFGSCTQDMRLAVHSSGQECRLNLMILAPQTIAFFAMEGVRQA